MSLVLRIFKCHNHYKNIHVNGLFTESFSAFKNVSLVILLIEIESTVYYVVYCQDYAVIKIQLDKIFSNDCKGAARTNCG